MRVVQMVIKEVACDVVTKNYLHFDNHSDDNVICDAAINKTKTVNYYCNPI